MITIGLTGSIAMGKSEVSRIFSERGIPVFDSDQEVHALYDSDEGVALLSPLVPKAIIDGKIHRPSLSKIVLQDPDLLNRLEILVHSEIAKRRLAFQHTAESQGHEIIVFDIPLLFEKQLEKTVDVTIVVSAPQQLQMKRAMARPGMTEDKLNRILARQMPDAEKRKSADYVIENDGTLSDLKTRTITVLSQIIK